MPTSQSPILNTPPGMPAHAIVHHASSHADVWNALRPLLPPNACYNPSTHTIQFVATWEIESVLNSMREHFPQLRYIVQDVGELAHGLLRVHINRQYRRIVTQRARRLIDIVVD